MLTMNATAMKIRIFPNILTFDTFCFLWCEIKIWFDLLNWFDWISNEATTHHGTAFYRTEFDWCLSHKYRGSLNIYKDFFLVNKNLTIENKKRNADSLFSLGVNQLNFYIPIKWLFAYSGFIHSIEMKK